jgi:UDP-3-O-[3-hydroxymyristoyl] glucosamine N-acyltransferase
MKIDRSYKALQRNRDGDYVLNDNLISNEDIEINLGHSATLLVRGSIISKTSIFADCAITATENIKAGWCLRAGTAVKAGKDIKAGSFIDATQSIRAGGSISTNNYIRAGWSVEAGKSIKAGWSIQAGDNITAKTFIYCDGRIMAGVSVWPVDAKYKNIIRCTELRKGEICFGILNIETDKKADS